MPHIQSAEDVMTESKSEKYVRDIAYQMVPPNQTLPGDYQQDEAK